MSEAGVSRVRRRLRAVPLSLSADDRLAREAAGGDTAAFAVLYERHHQPLYRYCRSILGDPDDAADALQSTMTRALAAIGSRDPAAPVRAWLFRIAHNESISLIRRRREVEPLPADVLVGADVTVDAERRRRLADLVHDLQGLSERQRGALLMREVSGLGHAEIASALGSTEGAVKQSIYEARSALQDLAEGREMSCAAARRGLSDGDGRTARSRRLRGHLRSCEDCRRFREALTARRSELALIAPLLPAGTAAAVLEAVIGGGGIGGGGLLAGLLGGGAGKAVAVGAATVTAGAGAASFTAVAPPDGGGPAPVVEAVVRPATPGGGAPAAAAPAEVAAAEEHTSRPVSRRDAGGSRGRSGRDEDGGERSGRSGRAEDRAGRSGPSGRRERLVGGGRRERLVGQRLVGERLVGSGSSGAVVGSGSSGSGSSGSGSSGSGSSGSGSSGSGSSGGGEEPDDD